MKKRQAAWWGLPLCSCPEWNIGSFPVQGTGKDGLLMSETMQEWLERELQDFTPVWKAFRNKQQRMYYLWMAGAVAGLVALGFGVGYDWRYVARVHLPIGLGIAILIWLFVLLSNRANTMKTVRKSFEEALSALSPADQEAFVRQDFGRADFFNTLEENFPARLLVGPDFWLYFRHVCRIYRVDDMEKLLFQEEKTQLRYKVGNNRVRQKVLAGVSLVIDHREKSNGSDEEGSGSLYLANWDQAQTAQELIAQYCPKAESLWGEK